MDNFLGMLLEWIILGINLYCGDKNEENEWYIIGIMIMWCVF